MKPKRIYCEARQLPEKEFEKIPMEEIKEMIGWIEPDEKGKWDVVMCDGGWFECKSQEIAQIISGCEEIKALFMTKTFTQEEVKLLEEGVYRRGHEDGWLACEENTTKKEGGTHG